MASSPWVWVLLFALVVAATLSVEAWESGGYATVAFIVTFGLLQWGFKLNVFRAAWANHWSVGEWIVVWYAAGAAWGAIYWTIQAKKRNNRYLEARAHFLKQKEITELTPKLAVEFAESIKYSRPTISPVPPSFHDHKGDIMRWMTYWPFSILGYLLHDLAAEVWNYIYTLMGRTYDRIAEYIYRNVKDDIALINQGRAQQEEERQGEQRKRTSESSY